MIISKDLFIFGEQIFATIIPEGGSAPGTQSQSTQQQQQQQQQTLQQHQPQLPAIINTQQTAATTTTATIAINATTPTLVAASASASASAIKTIPTTIISGVITAQTVALAGAAEQVVDPLKTTTAGSITTPATAAAAAAAATSVNTKTLIKQETVAVVAAGGGVGGGVGGGATAAVTAKKTKILKIPKEGEESKIKKKERHDQQQKQQHKCENEERENYKQKLSDIAITTTTTTTPAKRTIAINLEDDDDDVVVDDLEKETEQEPLVRRNINKLMAAGIATTTTTTSKTSNTYNTTSALKKEFIGEALANFAQQQQKHNRQQETLPLLCVADARMQQQQHQQPSNDCCLQLEVDQVSLSPKTTITTTASPTTSQTTIDCSSNSSDTMPNVKNHRTVNMDKTHLDNKKRSDHAMVTFPFINEQHPTLQLTFQNINVLHNERKILSDVSGLVSPGEVLAIMGPSGSGKTTLLDCLSGQRRIDAGSIHLNREPLSKKWRRKIGYVLQEEIFFTQLTLRETVMYTALLRLPEKIPKAEKIRLVDRILETLELNFCQQTKFGDYLNRGLSGGEKKRANIACELLTNPLLMLLDEPTSGLDSHSAISLMKVLKRYALQEQKTIVITVHQPSSQMFHMFDKLLLLHNGRTAYFGEVNNIYRYFEDIGVAIKPHYNPADFVLEQLKSYPDIREKLFIAAKESHGNFLNRNCITVQTNNHHNQQHHQQQHHQHQEQQHHHHQHHLQHHHHQHNGITVTCTNGKHHYSSSQTNNDVNDIDIISDKSKQHDSLINDIINNYYKDIHNNHNHHNHNHLSRDDMLMNACEEAAQQLVWCSADSQSNFSSSASSDCQSYDSAEWLDYPTRFLTQFRVLSSRNFKEAKPRMLSKLNWFQTIGLALMAGAIWFQIPRTEEFLHDLQGWMFFSQTYWMLFALFGALNSFPSEREVISKERRSGAYRLSAYYLAKMFGELPLVITLPTVYLMISYPMLGCTSCKLFFLMLVFLLLNTIVAQSVGFFIGACCMDMNVSITLSALYTLATQLFGGYLSSRIPDGLSWIRYTSMIHYAYQNMQILEFREGPAIRCGDPSSYEICKNNSTTFIPYEEILKAQNSTSPLWLNTLILMMFFLVFRGLGYAVLRYVRCPKT